jgi:hypothetical protein
MVYRYYLNLFKTKICIFNKSLLLLILLTLNISTLIGQSIQQQEMQKLSHFVGDWVGVSKAFENGKVIREIPAYEKISYKVDKHILTIDLYSESLKLHTVIYFDEKSNTYYYNPYYKTGASRYPAKLVDGKLIVTPSKTKRFIFEIIEDGKFREYGENLIDDKWVKYFEDVFEIQ